MNGEQLNILPPEHESLLNSVINTGETPDWIELKDVLRARITANVSEYIHRGSDPIIERSNLPATKDGLVIPPFKPRQNNPKFGPTRTQPSEMSEEEAKEELANVLNMLEGFTDAAPFTVKRLCELALLPRNHYRTVGKYLRGIERVLLVTSSPQSFAVPQPDSPPSIYTQLGMDGVLKTVSTPIFSPITFLHEDARRSQSRSPPASPLRLSNALSVDEAPTEEPKGLGLVDELDTPEPGHMANKPSPLSATTDVEQPLLGSLAERFVKGSEDYEIEKGGSKEKKEKGPEEGKNEDVEVENMVLSQEEESHS